MGAAGTHTHVSARELGARLLAEGRAAVGIGGGGGGSDSATAGVTPSLGGGLPAPPATPAPSSPGGIAGDNEGVKGGIVPLSAGAEVGVSAYELGARLRREEKKRLDFESKTI